MKVFLVYWHWKAHRLIQGYKYLENAVNLYCIWVLGCNVSHRPTPSFNLHALSIFLLLKKIMGATTEQRNRMFSLIENWRQSGLSQKAFCEQQQIAAHQFYYWYKIYRLKNDVPIPGVSKGFIELHAQEPSPEASIEILLSCGHRLLFHQPVAASFIKAIIS